MLDNLYAKKKISQLILIFTSNNCTSGSFNIATAVNNLGKDDCIIALREPNSDWLMPMNF